MKVLGFVLLVVGFLLDLSIFWIGNIAYSLAGVVLVAIGSVAFFGVDDESKPSDF